MRLSRSTLPVLLLSAVAGCGDGDAAEPSSAAVRDSAGIAIVENTGDGWKDGEGWSVAEEPSVEIGVTEGEREYQLDHVSTALRMADGRIVVANGGTDELRVYDARGRYLAASGGEGAGPGEFRTMSEVRRLPGDTLLVYDGAMGRLSYFDPSVRYLRSMDLAEASGGFANFVERLEDGSLLLTRSLRKWKDGAFAGTVRDTLAWVRLDPAAAGRTDTVATSAGSERRLDIRPQADGRIMMGMYTPPFLRDVEAAAGRGGWWQGLTERYELTLRRADGTPLRIVRRTHTPVPVKGAYLDSLRRVNAAEARARGAKPGGPDPLDRVELPESLPAFSRLLVDDDGNLWVQTFPWSGAGVRPRWEVFDPEGRLLGAVDLPPGLRATHVGRDFVLGVWKDEADVEFVRMYPLRKP